MKKLQNLGNIEVRIEDIDLPEKEADLKLVRLAEMKHAKIITNDYNLNKIASIRGVVALNLNELAAVLKPIFLPGEEIRMKLVKRGKEIGQAVGYLDDGTVWIQRTVELPALPFGLGANDLPTGEILVTVVPVLVEPFEFDEFPFSDFSQLGWDAYAYGTYLVNKDAPAPRD